MTKKKKTIMSFATILCRTPENVYGRLKKITGNGLAAGCQLFYCKIYGYFYSVFWREVYVLKVNSLITKRSTSRSSYT